MLKSRLPVAPSRQDYVPHAKAFGKDYVPHAKAFGKDYVPHAKAFGNKPSAAFSVCLTKLYLLTTLLT